MADVEIHRDGPVIEIRLNRPAKKNAITNEMYTEVVGGLETLEADDTLVAGVITAEGTDFCAGNDIVDFVTPRGVPSGATALLETLPQLTKPLVAAVQGKSVGIGATLLLHCDLVYVANDLDLRFIFVDMGLVPEAGSTMLLPRLVGRVRSAEAMLLASSIDAVKAVEGGIANASVEADLLRERAIEAAHALAKKPPNALRAAKALLRGETDDLVAHIQVELEVFSQMLTGTEFTSAAQRFLKPR
jgi:enoyl-CoA hydratase/carnithine racemase